MLNVLIDSVDWFEVLFNAPICFSGFGVGLCVRGFICDCVAAPVEVQQW